MKLEAAVTMVVLVLGSLADGLQETALSSTCAAQQIDRWGRTWGWGRRNGVTSSPGFSVCLGMNGFNLDVPMSLLTMAGVFI